MQRILLSDVTIANFAKEQPGLLVTDESGKEAAPGFSPPHPDTGQQAARDDSAAAPWRRPASLRARPSQR